jgi:hypothetical protein
MQRWLMASDEHLRLEFQGNAILGHSRQTAVDELPVNLQQVYRVYLRVPDKAWDPNGVLV